MKKALTVIAVLVAACIAGLCGMTVQYTKTADYHSSQFDAGYIINGVRCYDMSYEDAAKKITREWNAGTILVVGKMDEPLASYSDIDCSYDITKQVAAVRKNHPLLCALHHYLNIPVSIRVPMKVTKAGDSFRREVTESAFLARGSVSETRDAYVDTSDPSFPIVPEVYGTKPDTEKYFNDILECLELGEKKFVYDESNYVATPKVKSDDPKLLAYQKFCQTYLLQKITYDLGEDSFTIPQNDLESLLKKDLSGQADEAAVRSYVTKIAKRYDNVGEPRKFTTLAGKTIRIDNDGNYGWSVDQEGEAAQLTADINSHKDVSREPVWATTGYGSYSLDIGDTYIDIDVSRQELIYFENGAQRFRCDVVTGCRNTGTTTPTGLFSVLDKSRNVTLKGKNADGSKYESFVSYWMAFLGSSYGMHDATWRSSFGGDIWITSGSHGCVNMPPDRIPELYDMVSYGTPVIVHY